jgi:type IX secretion system PorP/SprF family membrane protein
MKSLKKYTLLVFIAFVSIKSYAQQTIQFSQYMFNGLAVNPAYAGYKEDWTINLSGRQQWTGVDGSPKTATISVDGVTSGETKNMGLGFLVTNDRLGPENNSAAYVNYSYRLRLDDDDTKRLCFGVAAGVIQYTINGSLFNASDITDSAIPVGTQSNITPDFRAGIYYYSPAFYLGASMLNLVPQTNLDPNTAILKQERTLYVTAGFMVPLSEAVNWKPSAMVKEDFKGPTNLNIASLFLLGNVLWLGAGYSTGVTIWNKPDLQSNLSKSDDVSGIVEVNISPRFRVGYSYDFVTSKLPGYQSGSHEISVSMGFGRSKGRILSPRFF